MNLLVTIPRQALFAAMFAVAILTAIGIAANFGVLLGNASPSVPRGL